MFSGEIKWKVLVVWPCWLLLSPLRHELRERESHCTFIMRTMQQIQLKLWSQHALSHQCQRFAGNEPFLFFSKILFALKAMCEGQKILVFYWLHLSFLWEIKFCSAAPCGNYFLEIDYYLLTLLGDDQTESTAAPAPEPHFIFLKYVDVIGKLRSISDTPTSSFSSSSTAEPSCSAWRYCENISVLSDLKLSKVS